MVGTRDKRCPNYRILSLKSIHLPSFSWLINVFLSKLFFQLLMNFNLRLNLLSGMFFLNDKNIFMAINTIYGNFKENTSWAKCVMLWPQDALKIKTKSSYIEPSINSISTAWTARPSNECTLAMPCVLVLPSETKVHLTQDQNTAIELVGLELQINVSQDRFFS